MPLIQAIFSAPRRGVSLAPTAFAGLDGDSEWTVPPEYVLADAPVGWVWCSVAAEGLVETPGGLVWSRSLTYRIDAETWEWVASAEPPVWGLIETEGGLEWSLNPTFRLNPATMEWE